MNPTTGQLPPGPLGFIVPSQRTQEQADAHAKAMAMLPKFAMAGVDLPVGTKIMLTDFWKDPDVIVDIGGQPFTGYGQYTGSCFPAGTPVRMADGSEKPVETVVVGDRVITHTGQARRVTNTFRRNYTGELVSVKLSGFPFPLEMTADHQVAIADGDDVAWRCASDLEPGARTLLGWGRGVDAPEQLDTVAMLGDDVVILDELMKPNAFTAGNQPDVPQTNFKSARAVVRNSGIDWHGRVRLPRTRADNTIFRYVPVCPSLGRLVGLYLAEGGTDAGRVVFTFNITERDTLAAETLALVRGLFGVEGEILEGEWETTGNRCTVRFTNLNLTRVFEVLVPGNLYTKRVPGIFFRADEPTRLAVLLGWMAGDGHVGIKGGKNPGNIRLTGVSVNAGLARDMGTIALSCGLRATVTRRKARKQSKVSYAVDLCGKKAVSLFPAVAARANGPRFTDRDSLRHTCGYVRPVRDVTRRTIENYPVYDFEVEDDHSFIAGGIVVHNCVGVSEGNALATVGMVQRKIADNPTKAFLPWWPFPYGRTRYNEGDRGQGEGAVDSVMGETLVNEGFFDITEAGLPAFTKTGPDGWWLSKQLEYQWSDGGAIDQKWRTLAKTRAGMTKAVVADVMGIRSSIANGYPILDGCFVSGTPIQMADGTEKAIEDIQAGDTVIAHTGVKRKVSRATRRQYTGDLFTFHVKGHPFPFTVTGDHKVVVVPGQDRADCNRWDATGAPTKIRACEVKEGDRMLLAYGLQETDEAVEFDLLSLLTDVVDAGGGKVRALKRNSRGIVCNRRIPLNESLAWLLGLYAAEGSAPKYKTIFSLGKHETLLIEQVIETVKNLISVDVKVRRVVKKDGGGGLDVSFNSVVMADFFRKVMPGKAFSKRVPSVIFRCSRAVRLAFLRGWMDGDGHFCSPLTSKSRNVVLSGTSVSDELIRGVMRLALSCGLKPSAGKKSGRERRRDSYSLFLCGTNALTVYPENETALREAGIRCGVGRGTRHDRLDQGFAVKVMKIEKEPVADFPVYCCQVEEDQSVIVSGLAVGNCANYIGNGQIVGSGDEAHVEGHYDRRGGHSTCYLGVWNTPTYGYLYLYSNQWPTSTYPRDPAGGGRCCVWVREKVVEQLFNTGGDNGETMALSHAPSFPVQIDKILDYVNI